MMIKGVVDSLQINGITARNEIPTGFLGVSIVQIILKVEDIADSIRKKRLIVIPDWPAVPVLIIKNNLRTASMSREEYFDLLDRG